jgi:hypothetical protein
VGPVQFPGQRLIQDLIDQGAFAGTGGYYMNKYMKTKKAYDRFQTDKEAFELKFPSIEYPFEAPQMDLESKKKGTWLLVGAGLFYW